MSEDTTTTMTETSSEGESGEITWDNSPIAQVYNPDGTPKAEAATALAELGKEDIAGYTLRNGQDFFTALKTGKDATAFASQKMDGVVKLPGEAATDEDRAAFNKSLGALDSPEEYLKDIWPDDLPEGFEKDEGLASLFAEHATKNPVLNSESVKGLVGKFIAHQQSQIQKMEETSLEQAQQTARSVKDSLTVELGGSMKFEQFEQASEEAMVSNRFKDFGFEFKPNESGQLESDNPLHNAMMHDPAFLRMLKSDIDQSSPAGIPGSSPRPVNQANKDAEAQKIFEQYGSGGWKDSQKMEEYYRLKGIVR